MGTHEVQTRDEAGATLIHETIADAFEYAKANFKIWKVSWTDAITGERVRLVRDLPGRNNKWFYDPIVIPLNKGEMSDK